MHDLLQQLMTVHVESRCKFTVRARSLQLFHCVIVSSFRLDAVS